MSVEKNWKWQSLTICSQLLKNSTILQDPLPFEGLDNQKSIISQLICKKKNFKTISLTDTLIFIFTQWNVLQEPTQTMV